MEVRSIANGKESENKKRKIETCRHYYRYMEKFTGPEKDYDLKK